jgi:hypothetical protein
VVCDAMYFCGRIPTFRRPMLPPSSDQKTSTLKVAGLYTYTGVYPKVSGLNR